MEGPSLVVLPAGVRRSSGGPQPRRKARGGARIACLCVLSLLCWDGAALAAPGSDDLPRARALFREAEQLERDARWQAAAVKLEAALGVKETPGLRYHLAFCQERLGQLVKALDNYERAGALIAAGADAPDVSDLLGVARADLEQRVPTLTVRVSGSYQGVRMLIDEQAVDANRVGHPIRLDPGTHHLRVEAADHHPFELEVTLAERDRKLMAPELDPRLLPAVSTGEGPASPADTAGSPARNVVLVAEAAVAVAALGVGIGYSVARARAERRAADARSELDELGATESSACHDPPGRLADACAELADANRDGIRASDRATIGFIGAGIAAAATIATWYFWQPSGGTTSWAVDGGPTAGRGVRLRLTASF